MEPRPSKSKASIHLHGTDFTISPDRIEAGTFLILGALSKGKGITVKNVEPEKMSSLLNLLRGIGCELKIGMNEIHIKSSDNLRNFHVTTKPYPGFPTDLGQLATVLMLVIGGNSSLKRNDLFKPFFPCQRIEKNGRGTSGLKVTQSTCRVPAN